MKGYERSKINLASIKRMDHNELSALMTTKKSLQLELTQYQSNAKVNKDHMEYATKTEHFGYFQFQISVTFLLILAFVRLTLFRNEDYRVLASDGFGMIPASTRLQVALATVASAEQKVTQHMHITRIFAHCITIAQKKNAVKIP